MGQSSAVSILSRLTMRLLRDRSGNTLAMIAAALVPLLAMVGGGIDMGRSYLSQSRLQQACDAGVLAARKKLGSQVVVTGVVPADVADVGNRFFNLNFGNGSYGTTNRNFQMTMEGDYSISGTASVEVPTSIMALFGYSKVDVAVECGAKLNFSNTDVMFVLDTTGSMAEVNAGDTVSRIDALRGVVKNFHAEVEGSKSPDTRVRYGFVPYSTNVNVGGLLKADWMVDEWTYQSREYRKTGSSNKTYYTSWVVWLNNSATGTNYTAATCPTSTKTVVYGPTTTVSASPHEYWYTVTIDGEEIASCTFNDDGSIKVYSTIYDNHSYEQHWKYSHEQLSDDYTFTYKPMTYDVSGLKTGGGNADMLPGYIVSTKFHVPQVDGTPTQSNFWYTGCIEERSTYEIDDYANPDLSRALDLDLDLVPNPGDPDTQWRPQLKDLIFDRGIWWDGSGTWSVAPTEHYWDYLNPGWSVYAACPSPAARLAEMSSSDIASYVDGLQVAGSTYHDIGMIWGGRLLSPTGLFADDNADVDGKVTSRHLIFLTDGETAPLDISYSAYGVEPLDQRR